MCATDLAGLGTALPGGERQLCGVAGASIRQRTGSTPAQFETTDRTGLPYCSLTRTRGACTGGTATAGACIDCGPASLAGGAGIAGHCAERCRARALPGIA
ncbi:hypothetical protein D3C76_1104330 [compost metagenome]